MSIETAVRSRLLRRDPVPAIVRSLTGLLVGLLVLVAVAVPAGAADAPPSRDPARTLTSLIDSLLTALDPLDAPACDTVGSTADIPALVGDIFRCRALEAGFPAEDADRIAAEAIVVSFCESRWDPAIVVFDGRYRDAPHPATGSRYSAAGVFQFIRKTADRWIPGGYANVTDPRLNIDAAARLYLHNRARGFGGWDDWACAAANDGFKVGSVLPGWPGGPAELPAWAWTYLAR